jgi:arsenate reductase-like glutaredoxin family protein
VLDSRKTRVREDRFSNKQPLTDAEARSLIKTVDRVVIARGKNVRELTSSETTLDDLRGPSGKFRAPMVRKGGTLLVGFSDEELRRILR